MQNKKSCFFFFKSGETNRIKANTCTCVYYPFLFRFPFLPSPLNIQRCSFLSFNFKDKDKENVWQNMYKNEKKNGPKYKLILQKRLLILFSFVCFVFQHVLKISGSFCIYVFFTLSTPHTIILTRKQRYVQVNTRAFIKFKKALRQEIKKKKMY